MIVPTIIVLFVRLVALPINRAENNRRFEQSDGRRGVDNPYKFVNLFLSRCLYVLPGGKKEGAAT